MKRRSIFSISLVTLLILIAGCSTTPPTLKLNKTIPTYSEAFITKEVFAKGVFVEIIGNKPNNLELAIMSALNERGMYVREKWKSRYVLTARISDEVAPKFGLKMYGTIAVNYKLSSTPSSNVPSDGALFERRVRTEASGTIGDALLGVERSVLVVEKYIKANVEELLRGLDGVSYRESQRIRTIELLRQNRDRRLKELSQKILSFDIFSRPTFFEVYPYETNENYSMSEVLKNSKDNLLKRLMSARQDDLVFFKRAYYEFLDDDIRKKIDESLNEMEKSKPQTKRTKKLPPMDAERRNTWGLPALPN